MLLPMSANLTTLTFSSRSFYSFGRTSGPLLPMVSKRWRGQSGRTSVGMGWSNTGETSWSDSITFSSGWIRISKRRRINTQSSKNHCQRSMDDECPCLVVGTPSTFCLVVSDLLKFRVVQIVTAPSRRTPSSCPSSRCMARHHVSCHTILFISFSSPVVVVIWAMTWFCPALMKFSHCAAACVSFHRSCVICTSDYLLSSGGRSVALHRHHPNPLAEILQGPC